MSQPQLSPVSDSLTVKSSVLDTCHRFMRPLARFLVRCGIGFKEFSEVAKTAFVEVVSSDYGIRGRPANISKVAVRTGLTRKEVSRIRNQGKKGEGKRLAPVGRPERVLEAWHNLDQFVDESGSPKRIPVEGLGPTFVSLVRLVGGDIPPRAMLKELINAGSVVEHDDGTLTVVSRSFIPDATDPEALVLAGEALYDLITTINYNLFEADPGDRRLERRVYGDRLSVRQGQEFHRIAVTGAEDLIESLNAWIAEKESASGETSDAVQRKRIGLGIYLFEEDYEDPK